MNAEGGWADLELAQRIARAGTLSGAARALHVDQTTASRRLAALERRLGVALFDRIGGRLAPTPALGAVLDRLQAMDEDAAVALAAMRRSEAEARGLVRIASVGFVLAQIVAPALGAFARAHPGVAVALHADDQLARFDRREADIAVRLGASGDDSALARKIGEARFRLCRAVGAPGGADAPPVVRYTDALGHAPEMRLLDRLRPGARAVVRADRLDVLSEAAVALGAELMLPVAMARRDPRFAFADDCAATRPIYRLVHADRARAPSVAAATRWIDETVAAWTKASASR
ncbi:MAG: LysR family transcriptional regulator [Roseiarcus sp.]